MAIFRATAARRAPARILGAALLIGALSSTAPAHSAPKEGAANRWVDTTLAKMTLEEKVGQLFVVNAFGASVRDDDPAAVKQNHDAYGLDTFEQIIIKYHVGGFYYTAANFQNPMQLVGLSNGIQQVATSQHVPVPSSMSMDQEGGTVLAVTSPAAVFPGNMAQGAIRDPDVAGEAAKDMGQELRAMGVNTDLAPVVDVNTNPLNQADGSRSYSDRTSLAADMANQQVRGFQDDPSKGVAATAKHFPGLGSAAENTDLQPAVSDRTLAQLQSIDLPPFRRAIKAGARQVMSSFLTLPNVDDSRLPAAFSSKVVTGLLRNDLRFRGVVITDALQAGAVKALNKPAAEIAVMALNAGNDQLLELAQGGPADLDAAYNGVLQAVGSGQISTSRIDDSVRRVLHEKWWLGLVKHPYQDATDVDRIVGSDSHLKLAEGTSRESITMLRNNNKLLPLSKRAGNRVLVTGYQTSTLPCVDTVAQAIDARGPQVTAFPAGFNPDAPTIDAAVAKAQDNDVVVVTTYNVWRPSQRNSQELIHALARTGKPVIVIAQGAPYDIAYLPDVGAFLGIYNYRQTSLLAAVDVLFGDVNPSGKLPVTVTEPPPSTKVLFPFGYGQHYPD